MTTNEKWLTAGCVTLGSLYVLRGIVCAKQIQAAYELGQSGFGVAGKHPRRRPAGRRL